MSKPPEAWGDRPYSASLTVPNCVESIRPAAQFLVQAARSLHVASAAEHLFEVAIVEALSNAFRHGSGGRSDGSIICEMESIGRRLVVRIMDQGSGFTVAPATPPLERTADDIDSILPGGHGMHVIQTVFPTVRAIRRQDRFCLEMELTF